MLAEEAEALQSPSPLWKRIVELVRAPSLRGRQLIRAGMLNLERNWVPPPITSPVAWLPPPEWAFSQGGSTPAPPLPAGAAQRHRDVAHDILALGRDVLLVLGLP